MMSLDEYLGLLKGDMLYQCYGSSTCLENPPLNPRELLSLKGKPLWSTPPPDVLIFLQDEWKQLRGNIPVWKQEAPYRQIAGIKVEVVQHKGERAFLAKQYTDAGLRVGVIEDSTEKEGE